VNQWKNANPETPSYSLTLEQLVALASFVYPPERLQADWARPSREQWLTVFQSLGLVGAFWRL